MDQDNLNLIEDPSARANRLTESLRGLLKNEIAEYGGTEAFMRWVRYDESPAPTVFPKAKSSNKDYEQTTVYIDRQIKKEAWRKWEDATGGDLSDLVQFLLTNYLRDR